MKSLLNVIKQGNQQVYCSREIENQELSWQIRESKEEAITSVAGLLDHALSWQHKTIEKEGSG